MRAACTPLVEGFVGSRGEHHISKARPQRIQIAAQHSSASWNAGSVHRAAGPSRDLRALAREENPTLGRSVFACPISKSCGDCPDLKVTSCCPCCIRRCRQHSKTV